MPHWIDTHCHLDATEFGGLASEVRARALAAGVAHCVIPAVCPANFDTVRALAHQWGDSYALGIHPLYVKDAAEPDLALLAQALEAHRSDPRLVAVGEIGLDFFLPDLTTSPLREKQEHFYRAQLALARQFDLPVILHVRRSADRLLKHLRETAKGKQAWSGIAHAFNGSDAQAQAFVQLGFKLGLGGAVTYERALQLRRLAATLSIDDLVLETDSPDIPPTWLYKTISERQAGQVQAVNEPAELPRIAEVVAALRACSIEDIAKASTFNAQLALPKLRGLLARP